MVYVALAVGLFVLLTPSWPTGVTLTPPSITSVGVDLAERATLLLAIGTFALGYAALVQAISTERARLYRQAPGLEWRPELQGGVLTRGAPDAMLVPGVGPAPRLELRNHGPGTATNLRVRYAIGLVKRTAVAEYCPWPLFAQEYFDYDLRADPVPLSPQEPRSVQIFEMIVGTGHPILFDDESEDVVAQIVVECRCEDAEGNSGRAAYIGLTRNLKVENLGSPSLITNNEWTVMNPADTEFLLLNLKKSMRYNLPRPLVIGRTRRSEGR
jgi:hypothetical protein